MVAIPPDAIVRLDAIAAQYGISRSAVIRRAVSVFLRRRDRRIKEAAR